MSFFDYIRVAIKNLFRQKSRTFLTVIAITIGSLSVILMVSLLTGIRQSLIDVLESMDAFTLVTVTRDPNSDDGGGGGLITSGDGGGENSSGKILDEAVLKTLKALPNVVDATPIGGNIYMDKVKLEGQDKKMWSSLIAYESDTKVFSMPITAGRKLNSGDMDKIVIGTRFVKYFGYSDHPEDIIGKNIIFSMKGGGGGVPDWGPLPEKPPFNADKSWWEEQSKKTIEIKAEIVGIAQNGPFDDSQNYINIAWAQKLMTQVRWEQEECKMGQSCSNVLKITKDDQYSKNGYGSIILKTSDTKNLKSLSESVSKLGYGVATAEDMIEDMNEIFTGIGIVLGAIGGIALFVAAIGIINTMVMATYERTREIGVMRACGATRATIRHLFTFEASMLGFWGGAFGLGLSVLIGKVGTAIADKYAGDLPIPIDKIAQFPWWLIVSVLAFTTLIGLISGLYPAIKAARLNPVDALRYE